MPERLAAGGTLSKATARGYLGGAGERRRGQLKRPNAPRMLRTSARASAESGTCGAIGSADCEALHLERSFDAGRERVTSESLVHRPKRPLASAASAAQGRVGSDWLAGLVLRGIGARCTVLNQARLSRREPPERVSSGLRELQPSSPSSSKPHPIRRWIATLAREARLQRNVSTSAFWDLVRPATRSQLRWPSLGAVWRSGPVERQPWRPAQGHYRGSLVASGPVQLKGRAIRHIP